MFDESIYRVVPNFKDGIVARKYKSGSYTFVMFVKFGAKWKKKKANGKEKFGSCSR